MHANLTPEQKLYYASDIERNTAEFEHRIACQEKKTPSFLNYIDGETTLSKYLELDTWTPEQAACLVSGIKPDTLTLKLQDGGNPFETIWGDSLSGMVYVLRDAVFEFENDGGQKGVIQQMEGKRALDKRARVMELWNSRENPPAKVTPSDFVAWCETKEIDTTWLDEIGIRHSASAAKVEAGTVTTPADWRIQARAIADEVFDHDTSMNCRDSLKNYSSRVMKLMQERGIKGPRGIMDNPATIMREALQGKIWWANKKK